MPATDLVRDHTIYSCVMGSRAFGLATDDSDTDRRGVFLAPTALFWRFEKPPTHLEGPAEEQFSWERIAERTLEVYREAIDAHRSASDRYQPTLHGGSSAQPSRPSPSA